MRVNGSRQDERASIPIGRPGSLKVCERTQANGIESMDEANACLCVHV